MLLTPLLLAACAAARDRPAAAPASTGVSAIYRCADGRTVEVLYAAGDAAVVTVGGEPVQMARAVAADGERYVGPGWQWWGKGARDGMLAPLAAGEQAAATPGTACHAS